MHPINNWIPAVFFVFVFVLIGIHSMQAEEPVGDTDLPEKKQEEKDKVKLFSKCLLILDLKAI